MKDQQRDDLPREGEVDQSIALAYANLVFANVVDWYKNADSKAQIILTLDGALVAFLTSSIFKEPEELWAITRNLTLSTWVLLMAMCACLVGSIITALMCLWSRVFLGIKATACLAKKKGASERVRKYTRRT
jgi:hypothetical protein